MREDFDPNWPHGHVTRNGLKYYGRLVGADGSSAGWIEGLLGHERAEHDENGLYLNRHPKWTREDYPYDLVNAPAPASAPRDETAALKARIARIERETAEHVARIERETAEHVARLEREKAEMKARLAETVDEKPTILIDKITRWFTKR